MKIRLINYSFLLSMVIIAGSDLFASQQISTQALNSAYDSSSRRQSSVKPAVTQLKSNQKEKKSLAPKSVSRPQDNTVMQKEPLNIGELATKPISEKLVRHNVGQVKVASTQGVLFAGLQEQGVLKNTFLCQGSQFEGSVCSQDLIDNAIGFDIASSRTLQFFNNFGYWLAQKEQRREYVKNDLRYQGAAIDAKMDEEGWAATSAYCIFLSTDPLLQKLVEPNKKVPAGKVKVIAQLLYNGNNLIQLWSQDVLFIEPGKQVSVIVTSQEDSRLENMLASSVQEQGVMGFIEQLGLQQNNRDQDLYSKAQGSPRMIRLQAS